MGNNTQKTVLLKSKKEKLKNGRKLRDTTLIRVDRKIKEEVKELSKKIDESMSWVCDHALREYIKSIELLD